DRGHAQRILADAAQREAERRGDQASHDQECQEQRGERIGVGDIAPQIEREIPKEGPHPHALQPIRPASEPMCTVRGLSEEKAEAKRDHDQGEMAKARDDEAREIAKEAGRRTGEQQSGQRLAPSPFRNQAGRVGAKAEKRSMAERNNSRIAENEIEREREQRRDRDLARELQITRGEPEWKERGEPEHDFSGPPSRLRGEMLMRVGGRWERHRLIASRTGRPAATSTASP